MTTAIGSVIGACFGSSADYGPDGQFCTGDDPVSSHGMPRSIQLTTGSAMAEIGPLDFETDAPISVATGSPFACTESGGIAVGGTELAGASAECSPPAVAGSAFVVNFVCE
jgi:hypothetical protein